MAESLRRDCTIRLFGIFKPSLYLFNRLCSDSSPRRPAQSARLSNVEVTSSDIDEQWHERDESTALFRDMKKKSREEAEDGDFSFLYPRKVFQ